MYKCPFIDRHASTKSLPEHISIIYIYTLILTLPNTNPLHALKATVDYASFIATPHEDQTLSYYVIARFASGQNIPRYGLHGTAKIYGGYISIFFYLFRRPIHFVESLLGI